MKLFLVSHEVDIDDLHNLEINVTLKYSYS